MKRAFHFVVVSALASSALVFAQGADVNKLLADVRQALGGEQKLAAITSLTATGQFVRAAGESTTPPMDFEMAIQLPDKFMKKEVVAMISDTSLSRTSGFNGADVIEAMDAPPMMGGGGGGTMMIRSAGGGVMGGAQTPEQQAAARKTQLLSSRQEFARLTLGMFATSFKAYPLTFTYAGQANVPDGKADVLDVKGEGDFAAKLFIDTKTHLPLMLTWMAKEPMTMRVGGGPAGGATSLGGGGGQTRVISGGGGSVQTFGGGQPLTPEQRDQMMKDMDARMKEAEAQRRTVEFRMYYTKYKDIDGVKMPMQIQRSVDGNPTDELTFDRIKLNPKIDPKKFEPVK